MSGIFRPHVPQEKRSDRSARDRARHRHKIRQSIRDNIADIVAEESIIGHDRDKIIKVPIRSIKEYRFIYGENTPGAAQGNGDSKPGDIVQRGDAGQPNGAGEAGNMPGVDAFETDITLDELVDIMFEDLELPDLQRKALKAVESQRAIKRKGYRKQGIRPRLDKRRTARNRIKRMFAVSKSRLDDSNDASEDYSQSENCVQDDDTRFPFHRDDMRFHHTITDTRLESNAVIICIMDTSGSMGTVKKYLARSFYFLLYQFVRLKYRQVEVVFVAHHTEASEVTEQDFFHKVESGGTYISSGYQKAINIIQERYHPSIWNIYAFHCSDGDNFYSDNEKAIASAIELCELCNLFGYGEIKPSGSAYYSGSMLEQFKKIDKQNFQAVVIEKKEDLWNAFRSFLMRDQATREVLLGSNAMQQSNKVVP